MILMSIATGVASAIVSIAARLSLKLNIVIAYGVVSALFFSVFIVLFVSLFNIISQILDFIRQVLAAITFQGADFGELTGYVLNFLNCSGISLGLTSYFNVVVGSIQTFLLLLAGAIVLTVLRIVMDRISDVGKML